MQTNNNGNRDWNRNDDQENRNREEQRNMGSHGNAMDDSFDDQNTRSASPGRSNDEDLRGSSRNDDQSWDRENRDANSRTFNEDEESWEEEQRMGSTSSNRGTRDNNWNENDHMQRSPGRSSAEDQRDASSSDYYSDRDEERRRNNNSRSNNGDDF